MDFPFDIETLLKPDVHGFSIISSKNQNYMSDSYIKCFSEILNELGRFSSIERHTQQITTAQNFFNSSKTIILKCQNDLIIGFLVFDFRAILLRNEYNLNYFSKNLLTVSDFYVYKDCQRKNFGKEIFDKLINITYTKPVSMAFENPNKALMNFLYKHYSITNPIRQINNIITYCNFNDNDFNRYLDDYHRKIDINKMENEIDSYRKWSPSTKDYKIYNSDYSYKNIFPLQIKSKSMKDNNINNNRRYEVYNTENNKNNFITNGDKIKNIEKNYFHNFNHPLIHSFNNNSSPNIKESSNYTNTFGNSTSESQKQFHLLDKKIIFGKQNNFNLKDNKNIIIKPLIPSSNYNKGKNYSSQFNNYYFKEEQNSFDDSLQLKNPVKDNYYNHINDENAYFQYMLNIQNEKRNKLSNNINNLSERISENIYGTPQKQNPLKNDYYRKNRSFATLQDSIQNKMREEKDYNDYRVFQINNEYNNFNYNTKHA